MVLLEEIGEMLNITTGNNIHHFMNPWGKMHFLAIVSFPMFEGFLLQLFAILELSLRRLRQSRPDISLAMKAARTLDKLGGSNICSLVTADAFARCVRLLDLAYECIGSIGSILQAVEKFVARMMTQVFHNLFLSNSGISITEHCCSAAWSFEVFLGVSPIVITCFYSHGFVLLVGELVIRAHNTLPTKIYR